MLRPRQHENSLSAGFTIAELLIATAVFTVILLVATAGVLRFSHEYYRGEIESRTQNVARQLMNNVVQDIQFTPGSVSNLVRRSPFGPPGSVVGYCIGQSQRYSFALNTEVVSGTPDTTQHQGPHALVADSTSGCTSATSALNVTNNNVLNMSDPDTGAPLLSARELLGDHMRLAVFDISQDPTFGSDTYDVKVRVVYGDDDVLCSPSGSTCTSVGNPATLQCKSENNNEFCAVAEYSTTVKKRVN